MALTLLQRPEGHILSETTQSCTVTNSGGNALFTKATHGLSDGDVIYSITNIRDYNGFFVVDVQSVNTFLITEYSGGDAIDYVQSCTGEYHDTVNDHGWSCVHLPITYRLSNNKFPVNAVDTSRTVSSYTDDNGYLNLNLSGSLGSFQELDFIKISGATSEEGNGVFQVLDKYSNSDVTINLAYDSSYSFTGGTVQLFYSNYNVKVNVYAGLNPSHQWEAQKPYELVSTLSLIPDSNNECYFSINEILKSKINVTNDTLLGTLPTNIDAFTQFYIEYAESYDLSNAYTITEYESSFTSDQSNFEGFACNSVLPFKNTHSGYLSEYVTVVNSADSVQKWLTNFGTLRLFGSSSDVTDPYFDISFINDIEDAQLFLLREYYNSGSLEYSTEDNLGTLDQGVIRLPLDADCNYERLDITLKKKVSSGPQTELLNKAGSGISWVEGSPMTVTLALAQSSKIGYVPFAVPPGTYTVSITISNPDYAANVYQVQLVLLDSDLNTLAISSNQTINADPDTISVNLVSASSVSYIGVIAYFASGAGTGNFSANSFMATDVNVSVLETKSINIYCDCMDYDIRLTWLNNLGGFDYFGFLTKKEYSVNVLDSGTTNVNTFTSWPKSYGAFADTINKQTFRRSNNSITIISQYLTQDEADAISQVKTSPLVQIVNSRQDKRTVIVDTDSFVKYSDGDKLFTIQFNVTYTDDIPSQRT